MRNSWEIAHRCEANHNTIAAQRCEEFLLLDEMNFTHESRSSYEIFREKFSVF